MSLTFMTPENWPLKNHLPSIANNYCFQLWEKYKFHIKITAPRKSKLGDYRFRAHESHLITINNNLNPYTFLIVYLHEVAHCATTIKHGLGTKPHGPFWQHEMKSVVNPLLEIETFPQDIEEALISYLKAPRATSCAHPSLTRALGGYDPPSSLVALEQISEGEEFLFQTKQFRKEKIRRTRVFCLELSRNRTYLISRLAQVQPLGNNGNSRNK
jgi:hypothetical protein